MKTKKYSWKMGGFKKIDAEEAAKEIELCADENGDISATAVVERSRPKEALLHDYFEWNNDKAADLWREHSARVLICNIVVEIVSDDNENEPIPVRAFGHVQTGYKPIEAILYDVNDEAYLLEMARKDIEIFILKYKRLGQFSNLIKQMEILIAESIPA